ncbi:MAG: thermonuclease family protein [Desulfobacula sp.]|nr:thermonuclease family protein [Desulfobacula sp.]
MVEQWLKTEKIFHHAIFYFIIILLVPVISHAQSSIQGKVVSIADGDTIRVIQNSKQYIVRLYGIDTPEKNQDFGQKAKKFTSDMVFGHQVKVIPYDMDRYGRTIGVVYVDQKCLNEELIKNGFAWVYKKYCSKSFCNKWLKLEQVARENKFGLWLYDNPVPPWDFRRGKSSNATYNILSGFHGNVSSHVFHRPDCKHFNCKNCTKIFKTRESAINAGYRPCGFCKP